MRDLCNQIADVWAADLTVIKNNIDIKLIYNLLKGAKNEKDIWNIDIAFYMANWINDDNTIIRSSTIICMERINRFSRNRSVNSRPVIFFI